MIQMNQSFTNQLLVKKSASLKMNSVQEQGINKTSLFLPRVRVLALFFSPAV